SCRRRGSFQMWVEDLGLAAVRSAIAIIAEVVTFRRNSRCARGGRLPVRGVHVFSLDRFPVPKGVPNVESAYGIRRIRQPRWRLVQERISKGFIDNNRLTPSNRFGLVAGPRRRSTLQLFGIRTTAFALS